jgi:23S rRNA (guanosine2251-2'-O)-methyltransferase
MNPGDWVFGLHAVASLLERTPDRVQGLWVDSNRRDSRVRAVVWRAQQNGIDVHHEARAELDRLAGGGAHQGILARLAEVLVVSIEDDLATILEAASGPPLILALDGVQDPHNLGACMRSADAAGVHAVIAPADRAVGLTAAARKVACGAAETVPFVQVTNLARCLRKLKDDGLWVVGADGDAEDSVFDVDFTGPMVVVLGAEEKGLRRLTREECDMLAHIPMAGSVASLNVSVAAGVVLFEAVRQRRNVPSA